MINFFRSMREDVAAVLERDPAARSRCEGLLCYPGLHALWAYRLSHWLWEKKWHCLARQLSQFARFVTGVEIHPGARIGRRLFIDHGMGVVIGETAVLGDDITLYQGVTLGGTGKEKGKRHPTICSRVVVGAGAKVLGNIVIGENCRIGAGSVILGDVPENSTVVGVPGRIVYKDGMRVLIADPKDIDDPLLDLIASLTHQLQKLERHFLGLPASAAHGREPGTAPHFQTRPAAKLHLGNLSIINDTGAMTNVREWEAHCAPRAMKDCASSPVEEVIRAGML
jgi:serine O-acetyltransferase